jgi:outer membrane protein assembly factor BamE (lipoprotein component of BamABCDE complex)
MKPNIIEREVVEVVFNDDGIVKNVKNYELKDGFDVEFSSDKTESIATEQNVVEQLIGNIGKFNNAPVSSTNR